MQGELGALGNVLDVLDPPPEWKQAAMAMASKIEKAARQWWAKQGGFYT